MSDSKSKTILVFPFDLMSHYLRCMALVKEYAGNTVLFQSSVRYNENVSSEGFGLFNALHFDPGKVMKDVEKFRFNWLNEKDIERVFISQVEAIRIFKPDLVIGDTSPSLKMACEVTGTKYISLMNGYMSKYYAGSRPVPRSHFLYRPLRLLLNNLEPEWVKRGEDIVFSYIHSPFRKIRKKYNLKQQGSYLDELEGDETLICDREDLFPQRSLPASYTVIGPLLYNIRGDEDQLLSTIDHTKPTICISMGSTGNWAALEFLNDKKYAAYNIITAGDIQRVITGEHVFAKDFVNLDFVLPVCKYLICHGGNGTIYHGIKHKIPVLCVPVHFEQEWNAERVEDMGYGRWIKGDVRKGVDEFLDLGNVRD